MDFTEKEKIFLIMLFRIADTIVEAQDGYADFNGETFSRADLYYLSEKIGIEY